MEKDAQLVMRISTAMAERLKEYATKLATEFNVPVTTAAAARRLLAEGLEQAGFKVEQAQLESPDAPAKSKRGRPTKRAAKR
jgi:CO dehydrogenase/acetyl-CoA synthase epsilon subunit